MKLDLARWPQLSSLLDQVLDLPDPAARARWLEAMPAEHAIHRAELEMLLAGLESTRFRSPGVLPVSPEGLEAIDAVGPYRLQRELGRGGMAAVWLATPLEPAGSPPVALKLPLVSFDASLFLERFARERAFLARLAHPHIAAFRDAGIAPSGQQYLAMEYVDGGPITDHCDARGLDVSQRLATFRQVVGAVEYAHRAGILHRDIKPSNILVTAGGEARLVDFGVAKVLVGGRAEATTLTEASGRPLTPAYASPEQVAGGTLTEASDVYSLGVVLYELLTGARPPSAPRSAPIAPPSAAVTADSGVARAEGGERRLSRRLVGELDHVVLKALRDAPGERYASAALLGQDLDRILTGQPVLPRLELMRIRAKDSFVRHRIVASLVLILLATMSGLKAAHRAAADLQQLIEPPVSAAHQAVLVTIGPEDHARLFASRSPLDAGRIEALVRKVIEGRPASLGVDLDTSDAAFTPLRDAFAGQPTRIIWARGAQAGSTTDDPPRPRPFLGPGEPPPLEGALALVMADPDDAIVRRYSRDVATATGPMPAFAPAVAAGRREGPRLPDTEPLEIRFTRTDRPEFPASVVLASGFDWGDRIRDRVVILGGRYDRADVHRTPLGEMDGVDVVANIVESELRGGGRHPPHVAKVVAVGLIEVVALLLLFDHLPFFRAVAAAVAGTVAISFVLALTNVLPEWPYAFFALLLVLGNQLAIETVRNQRGTLKASFAAVKARLTPRPSAPPPAN